MSIRWVRLNNHGGVNDAVSIATAEQSTEMTGITRKHAAGPDESSYILENTPQDSPRKKTATIKQDISSESLKVLQSRSKHKRETESATRDRDRKCPVILEQIHKCFPVNKASFPRQHGSKEKWYHLCTDVAFWLPQTFKSWSDFGTTTFQRVII